MGRSHKQPQTVEDGRAIADSDDESIDDDEAFNSEDELRYGSFFSMTTKKKSSSNKQSGSTANKKVKVKNIGDDESVEESDDDDGSSGSEEASHSDDGESDENDWAGSDDDEDEEDDGGAYMLDLLNNLDNDTTSGDKSDSKKSDKYNGKIQMDSLPAESAVHLKESQFQAGALSTSGDKLTLDSLMGGIADTQGFSTVQKTMRVLSSGGGGDDDGNHNNKKLTTTAAPVARVVSERASRKVHYEASSKDVAQWQQVVHEQRDAETLDFRPNKNLATTRVTRDMLVEKFEAKTEFEAELAKALEVAGMEDEKIMRQKEKKRLLAEGESGKDDMFSDDESLNNMNEADDDLGSNRISIEEYKKRH
eukprot:scaffold39073_cov186-Skeletonema_marinoi.AAC.1